MAYLFPETHWRHYCYTQEYNDETERDILEAVSGAAWLCRHGHMASSREK